MLPAKLVRRSSSAIVAATLCAFGMAAHAQSMANRAEALNMQLVGFNDLQGRSAYQPIIHKQGNRYIAYVGHHAGQHMNPLTGRQEGNGTSVIDVTDPANPRYLFHIPGSDLLGDESEAQMVRAAVDRLPSDQRDVVALVMLEEYSYREAADMLGLPIGTVMSRLSRAKAALARNIAGEGAVQ